ncbi:MAG: DegT/DnrJ/EryC1/StrS family aminotransferase [Sporomusaceae bacterium]|nr:DegT/DnrJ/EryC1/StrS family aminotransferase [Sporomusaceae bacterium]
MKMTAEIIPLIDLKTQQEKIKADLDRRIQKVLNHGQYVMGPEVNELQEKLAAFTGSRHCITVANGTDALLIALMALGVKSGDEVITTPFTYIATGEVIARLGATPVFVDIDSQTYNLDPNLIEAAITPRTKAIMPVSLYGQCADIDAINQIAARRGLSVIEDGAQSFGATYKGRKSCSLSTIGCTSFFPSKPLGCYGDGGACFTDDDELAKVISQIRLHGQERRYHHERPGLNSRLDTLQAAVLLAKLEIFPEEISMRQQVADTYTGLLQGIKGVVTPNINPFGSSVYALYTIQTDRREELQTDLKAAGIPTAVHYPVPLNLQPVFGYLGLREGSMPVAESIAKKVMSLPMSPWLTKEIQHIIIDCIKKMLI